jgi:hypothetical protein
MRNYKNVRVTVVHREGEKDWEGVGRYLSIRAYTGQGDKVFMGPDIPISSELSDPEIERIVADVLRRTCGEDAATSSRAAA